MRYTVSCSYIDSQALIFTADELFNIIKHDDKTVMEELKRSYWCKLPMPRDNQSTFKQNYNKLARIQYDSIKDKEAKEAPE